MEYKYINKIKDYLFLNESQKYMDKIKNYLSENCFNMDLESDFFTKPIR